MSGLDPVQSPMATDSTALGPQPSTAPTTTSMSPPPAPTTNAANPQSQSPPPTNTSGGSTPFQIPQFSASTEEILKRVSANNFVVPAAGTPGWEAARQQVLKSMVTSDKILTPPPQDVPATARAASAKVGAVPTNGHGVGLRNSSVASGASSGGSLPKDGSGASGAHIETPRGRGRGRGRGSGRGRGRGGGRGGKRKRNSEDGDDATSSSDGETYTPLATTTKSGRTISKPTSYVPPPPSAPASGTKRKRAYNRKNPELTVCVVCERPHSPESNAIVFCDGCNTPWHRYCHFPPIEQVVVDVPEMEWFCARCRREKAVKQESAPAPAPAPVSMPVIGTGVDISVFASGEGLTVEQVSP